MSLVRHRTGERHFNRAYESLLTTGAAGRGKYVHPGRARTSPVVWQILGRNTARPWDGDATRVGAKPAPDCGATELTPEEKRTFIQWIDLGALWDGIPGSDDRPGDVKLGEGRKK